MAGSRGTLRLPDHGSQCWRPVRNYRIDPSHLPGRRVVLGRQWRFMIRTVIHRPFTDGFRLPTGRSSEQSIELLASYDVALGWLGANSPNGGNITFPAVVVRASTAL